MKKNSAGFARMTEDSVKDIRALLEEDIDDLALLALVELTSEPDNAEAILKALLVTGIQMGLAYAPELGVLPSIQKMNPLIREIIRERRPRPNG